MNINITNKYNILLCLQITMDIYIYLNFILYLYFTYLCYYEKSEDSRLRMAHSR